MEKTLNFCNHSLLSSISFNVLQVCALPQRQKIRVIKSRKRKFRVFLISSDIIEENFEVKQS